MVALTTLLGAVLIETMAQEPGSRRLPATRGLRSATIAILLPISCGLVGGYLDVVFIVFKKFFWKGLKNFAMAHDFPWSVPVGHVLLLAIPGVLLAMGQPASAPSSLAARHGVAFHIARPLGCPPAIAPLRHLEPASRRRTWSAGQRCCCGPFSTPAAALVYLRRAGRNADYYGGSLVRAPSSPGIPGVGGLARPAIQRSQRHPDRLGRRACIESEPLRPSPQHHPQPGPMGPQGGPLQYGSLTGPRPIPRIRASSPGTGRSS